MISFAWCLLMQPISATQFAYNLKLILIAFTLDNPEITAIQHISSNSAILRKIDIDKRENVLLKSRADQRYVLRKQVDGLLCTDGYLQYSKQFHQLVYTYRYRNQFICLDTNLNVVRIEKQLTPPL